MKPTIPTDGSDNGDGGGEAPHPVHPPPKTGSGGGGAHNSALLRGLREKLPEVDVRLTDSLGIAADWVEAAAFAWLASQAIRRAPGNLPAVTGAKGERILGAVYAG